MVRYKRYRRRRRSSTGIIKMKFQSFMDISTSASSMQIITISAGGPEILRRLAPQFSAYKYYKIGNISCKLVPASTLPVDPTGLSIAAGDNLVDPRDQLTPGMMRITNGEDIFEDLTGLTEEEQFQIYNNMLLDPRWFKWMLQSGVKRHATPRYWQVGQLHQDKYPGAITNLPLVAMAGTAVAGTVVRTEAIQNNVGNHVDFAFNQSSPYGFFQTGHRGVLGWLPTDGLQPIVQSDGNAGTVIKEYPLLASPPEVEVMKILLPRAHKTRYWYRMFISETVYFREPIVNYGIVAGSQSESPYLQYSYRPLDVFHTPGIPSPRMPDYQEATGFPSNSSTGGNYGNN